MSHIHMYLWISIVSVYFLRSKCGEEAEDQGLRKGFAQLQAFFKKEAAESRFDGGQSVEGKTDGVSDDQMNDKAVPLDQGKRDQGVRR